MKKAFTTKQTLLAVFTLLALIVKSQMNINYQWAFNNKNTSPQGANVDNRGIVKDASGNIYVTGFFSNTSDFDPSVSISYLVSNGNADFYLAKYNSTGSLVWAKSIGAGGNDQAYGIALDNSNNIYVTGSFNGTVDFDPNAGVQNRSANGTNPDVFVAKYDPNGNYLFASTVGGSLTDASNAITTTSVNVFITGSFYGTADFDPSAATQTLTSNGGGQDMYILKLDLNGNYVNVVPITGPISETGFGIVADQNNGNIFVTGNFSGTADFDPSAATQTITSVGGADIFVAKYSNNLSYGYAIAMGGSTSDVGNALAIDVSGNVYVTGNFNGTADFDPSASTANLNSNGSGDIFFAKYDASGNYIYAKSVGGAMNDNATKIAIDAATNVYITGPYYSVVDFDPSSSTQNLTAFAGSDIYLAKYDATGNYVFANGFGDIGIDAGYGLFVDATDIYLAGNFGYTVDFDPSASTNTLTGGGSYTNVFFAKYDASGVYALAKNIGDVAGGGLAETSQAVVRDAAGNVYITGQFVGVVDFDPSAATQTLASVTNTTGTSTTDIFIAKYDAAGNYIWAKSMGGTSTDIGYGLKLDANGNVYVTGYYISTDCDFDPSAATQTLSTNGSWDVFLAKYTSAGNYVYAISFGDIGDDRGMSVTVDATGNAYVAGYFTGTVDFDPSASAATLTSAGGSDIFFAKYNTTGAYVLAAAMGGTNTGTSEQANSIEVDASNNIYVGGYYIGTADFDPSAATQTITSAGSQDAFFAKYSNTGAYIFAKSIGGTSGDLSNDMTIDGSNNIYITGYYGNATADFDPSASTQNLPFSGGGGDVYFAKYDANGNYVYAKGISGAGFEGASNIIVDGSNNVYLAGYFTGTTDFDPSASVLNLVGNGGNDIYVAKYDANGNYLYAKNFGSASPDVGYGVATDGVGVVYLTGTFNTTVDFDPSSATAYVVSSNQQDMFLAKYTECAAVTSTLVSQANILCNGLATGAATVAASGGSGFTYTWMPSGGTSTVASGLTAGTYSVMTANSCGAMVTQTLTITQPSAITVTAVSSTTVICAPNSVTLTASANGGTGTITYTWSGFASGTVVVGTPTANTSYTINVTDANNCNSSSVVNITVNASPTVAVVSSNTMLCSGQQATLTANGANTYTWSTSSSNTTIAVSPTVTTSFTVTGTSSNGCANTSVFTQSVTLCTGVAQFAVNEFTVNVFPNPNNGKFTISLDGYNESVSVEVFNSMGQSVLNVKPEGMISEINISAMSNGIYFVIVKEGGKISNSLRVIKN